jgi:hypothetical protein
MNTTQLKHNLMQRISSFEDIKFLEAIKTILDYNKIEPFIELTDKLANELQIASLEGKEGKVISQAELDIKVEQWLKEK